jgi:hypothetical protein
MAVVGVIRIYPVTTPVFIVVRNSPVGMNDRYLFGNDTHLGQAIHDRRWSLFALSLCPLDTSFASIATFVLPASPIGIERKRDTRFHAE